MSHRIPINELKRPMCNFSIFKGGAGILLDFSKDLDSHSDI